MGAYIEFTSAEMCWTLKEM